MDDQDRLLDEATAVVKEQAPAEIVTAACTGVTGTVRLGLGNGTGMGTEERGTRRGAGPERK